MNSSEWLVIFGMTVLGLLLWIQDLRRRLRESEIRAAAIAIRDKFEEQPADRRDAFRLNYEDEAEEYRQLARSEISALEERFMKRGRSPWQWLKDKVFFSVIGATWYHHAQRDQWSNGRFVLDSNHWITRRQRELAYILGGFQTAKAKDQMRAIRTELDVGGS